MNGEGLQTIIRFVSEHAKGGETTPQTGDSFLYAILVFSLIACIVCVSRFFVKRFNLANANNVSFRSSSSENKTDKLFTMFSVVFALVAAISGFFLIGNHAKAQADAQNSLTPTVDAVVSDSGDVTIDQAVLSSLEGINVQSVDTSLCDGISSMDGVTWNVNSNNMELYNGIVPGHKDLTSVSFKGENKINFNVNGMSSDLAKSLIGKDVALIKLNIEQPVPPAKQWDINLNVVNSKTLDPIPNAFVEFAIISQNNLHSAQIDSKASLKENPGGYTDENGDVTVTVPDSVLGTWKVSHDGYNSYISEPVSYDAQPSEKLTVKLDEQKEETVPVSGYVYHDDSYEGVVDASLEFKTEDNTYKTTSTKYGFFIIELPKDVEGTWTVSAEGYETATKDAKYSESTDSEWFRLKPTTPPEPEICTVHFEVEGTGSGTFSKNDIELPKGWGLYAYSENFPTIDIINKDEEAVDKVVCTVTEGNFEKWDPRYVKIEDQKEITIHAVINKDVPKDTLTFHKEGEGHLEISYDGKNWEVLSPENPMDFGQGAGYFNGEGKGDMYISTAEGIWICQVKAVPAYGHKFQGWDVVAGTEKHVITGDDQATATFVEDTPTEWAINIGVYDSKTFQPLKGAQVEFDMGPEVEPRVGETDEYGNVEINVPDGVEGVWKISYMGYLTHESEPISYSAPAGLSVSLVESVFVGGYVYQGESYDGIVGAELSFKVGDEQYSKTYETTSGENGWFIVELPKDADGTWTVSAEGYETATKDAKYSESTYYEWFRLNPITPPVEEVTVTFASDPVDSATFTVDGVAATEVSVPKGSFSHYYSSTTPELGIYKVEDGVWILLHTIKCVVNEGNTFKNWDQNWGYKELTEDATLTAYIDVPTPPVETVTVGGYVYINDTDEGIVGANLVFKTDDKTYECVSGQYGFFFIELPKDVAGVWTVSAEGYETATKDAKYSESTTSEWFRLKPVVEDTLTFHTEGQGHLEISYDGKNWETLTLDTPMDFGKGAGYFNGQGKGDMYISDADGQWICQVKAVADEGYTFKGWDVVTVEEKHVITGDDQATATFEKPTTTMHFESSKVDDNPCGTFWFHYVEYPSEKTFDVRDVSEYDEPNISKFDKTKDSWVKYQYVFIVGDDALQVMFSDNKGNTWYDTVYATANPGYKFSYFMLNGEKVEKGHEGGYQIKAYENNEVNVVFEKQQSVATFDATDGVFDEVGTGWHKSADSKTITKSFDNGTKYTDIINEVNKFPPVYEGHEVQSWLCDKPETEVLESNTTWKAQWMLDHTELNIVSNLEAGGVFNLYLENYTTTDTEEVEGSTNYTVEAAKLMAVDGYNVVSWEHDGFLGDYLAINFDDENSCFWQGDLYPEVNDNYSFKGFKVNGIAIERGKEYDINARDLNKIEVLFEKNPTTMHFECAKDASSSYLGTFKYYAGDGQREVEKFNLNFYDETNIQNIDDTKTNKVEFGENLFYGDKLLRVSYADAVYGTTWSDVVTPKPYDSSLEVTSITLNGEELPFKEKLEDKIVLGGENNFVINFGKPITTSTVKFDAGEGTLNKLPDSWAWETEGKVAKKTFNNETPYSDIVAEWNGITPEFEGHSFIGWEPSKEGEILEGDTTWTAKYNQQENVKVTLISNPEDSATFTVDGEAATEVSVPKGSISYNTSSTTPETYIYKVEDGVWILLHKINCVVNEGNTFKNWDQNWGYKELKEDATLTAYIDVPTPPAEEVTVTFASNPEDSATFTVNGKAATEVSVPKGSQIYSYATGYSEIDIYDAGWEKICAIKCIPNSGNTFKNWSTGYQLLSEDFTLMANIDVSTSENTDIDEEHSYEDNENLQAENAEENVENTEQNAGVYPEENAKENSEITE